MTNIIAKFRFQSIKTWMSGDKKVANLEFNVVGGTDAENKKFFEWTPYGKLELGTVNQAVLDSLDLNQEYYVIITKEKPPGI